MKKLKWWFYFTLVTAMVIAAIITDLLYINGLEKIFIFSIISMFIGAEATVLFGGFSRCKIIAFIFFLLIFFSSPFLIIVKPNEFAVFYRDGQMPVVLESYPKLAIPYTYDVVVFSRYQTLIIIGDNQRAVVNFELSRDSVFMVQHGFADQKDFADKIQAQAYSKFFAMNDADRKAYLDSFYDSYGLRWKKVTIEINIDNVQ